MKTPADPAITLDALLAQLKKWSPSIPTIVGVQLLSSLVANAQTVKNNKFLKIIFSGGPNLSATLLLAYIALKDMRETTADEFKDELKSYIGISKLKNAVNPFTVIKVGGIEETFTDLDRLAESLGAMRIVGVPDRASRSFNASRRTVILGWADPYLLRTAEFLAVRSVEQSMHELFPGKPPKNARPNWVTGITESCNIAFNKNGEPKHGAISFNRYLCREVPEIENLHTLLTKINNIRDQFAHWDDAESSDVFRLDLAPFQLARACLQYRNQGS